MDFRPNRRSLHGVPLSTGMSGNIRTCFTAGTKWSQTHNPIRRPVVFHADDLGRTRPLTTASVEAFTNGVLTSTSVLANGPNAENAIQRVLRLRRRSATDRRPESNRRFLLDDPVHIIRLGYPSEFDAGATPDRRSISVRIARHKGRFTGRCKLFATLLRSRGRILAALEAELVEQIVWVLDHGVRPTHVNGHQYFELIPGVSNVVSESC